jgi:hypothetical protein
MRQLRKVPNRYKQGYWTKYLDNIFHKRQENQINNMHTFFEIIGCIIAIPFVIAFSYFAGRAIREFAGNYNYDDNFWQKVITVIIGFFALILLAKILSQAGCHGSSGDYDENIRH